MAYLSSFTANSWLNDLEDIGKGQSLLQTTHPLMLVIICAKYGKKSIQTVCAVERTRQDVTYFHSFIAKSWLNDLEDISLGQWSLCMTHTLIYMHASDHLCLIWKEFIQSKHDMQNRQTIYPTNLLCVGYHYILTHCGKICIRRHIFKTCYLCFA